MPAAGTKRTSHKKAKHQTENEGDTTSAAVAAAAKAFLEAPSLFYTLSRARFCHPLRLTKVITVQLPVQHIRSKAALHEFVLKKLLHKPYAFSAEEVEELQRQQTGTSSAVISSSKGEEEAADPFVVVHISSIEPHADTVRQCNAHGDIQLNVMVSLTVARVRHGVLCGPCAASPFEGCFQVLVPCEATEDVSAREHGKGEDGRDSTVPRATAASLEEDELDPVDSDPTKLRITVRCLAEEPVIAGQSVFVVSEPGGSIRCMAVRPPREAPGPFRVVSAAATDADKKDNDAMGKRRPAKRGGNGSAATRDAAAGHVDRTVPGAVWVMCDIPPKEHGDAVSPPPRGKLQRREH